MNFLLEYLNNWMFYVLIHYTWQRYTGTTAVSLHRLYQFQCSSHSWRRIGASWRRIGALNDILDWVANALGLTFVDPNSWIEDGDFSRDGLHLNGRGKTRLRQLYARVSGLDVGGSKGSKKWQIWENEFHKTRDNKETRTKGQKDKRHYMKKMEQWPVYSWELEQKWGQG